MVRALLFCCVVCLGGAGVARAQVTGAPADAQQTLLQQLASTQGKIDCPTPNHCIFIGQVEMLLPGGQTKFFAEQIEIIQDKNQLIASGNVVFQNPGGQIAADSAEFNIKDNTGTFHVASGLMPLGRAADRTQFGNQEADVYFWGNTIEKLGDEKYRISKGGFTTCVQPTPRWEIVSDTATMRLDHYVALRNAVVEVKDVPVFYLPYLYYPIQKDDRATGVLLPMYGSSLAQGQTCLLYTSPSPRDS